MKVGIGGLLLALLAPFAFGQQAIVAVLVKEKSVQKPDGIPFERVGLFQVFRGGAKVDKASCPDYSNKDGKLSCIIPCSTADKVPGNFSIVPPDSGPRTKGYVAPPSRDVEILGCTVKPNTPREFEYVDSRFALHDLFRNEPLLAKLASVSGDGKSAVFGPPDKALPAMAELSRKAGGLVKLISLQKLTALAAERAQSDTDAPGAQKFTSYSIGASNVLLSEIARVNIGIPGSELRITGATADYYSNLKTLESGLEKKMGRTPAENLLLNDVQNLKQSPFKASHQLQIQQHLKIDRQ